MSDAEPSPGDSSGRERGWRAAYAHLTSNQRLAIAAAAVALAAAVVVLAIDDGGADEPAPAFDGAAPLSEGEARGDSKMRQYLCPAWSPSQFEGTAVDLPAAAAEFHADTVAESGLAELIRPLGSPEGYATLSEADGVAAAAVGRQASGGTEDYRWVAVRHNDGFYPFVARHFEELIFEDDADTDGVPNSDMLCLVDPYYADVQAWHALRFAGYYDVAWVRWDQNDDTLPTGQLSVYPDGQDPPYTGKAATQLAPGEGSARIVNGGPVTIEKLPWQVAVIASSPGGNVSLCGGTLVTSTVVLTAAHCVADGGKVVNDNPSRYRIVSGRTHLLATDEGAVTMPSEIRVPRDAQGNQLFDPQSFAWDVALVRLPVTAPGGTPIQIAGSADAEAWDAGSTAWVSGFGSVDVPGELGTYPDQLQAAQVEMLDDRECERGFFNEGNLPSTIVCAGVSAGRGTCTGDSGGPLVALGPGDEVLLVGATSFVQKESCKDFPHGFARVAADPILAWVHENVLAMTDENIMNVPDEG